MTLPLDAPSSLATERSVPALRDLGTHRRQVTVVFIDLRGFTAFSENAEPEDVVEVLREYHAEVGRRAAAHAILVSRRVFAAVEHLVEAEPIGDLTFKGFLGPVSVFNARSRKGASGVRARALIS